ncbi:SDR family NAD(P)-dependent oxidoreductase [Phenylobacterium sp.]|uniref:SDR family NAD(P)-dependent oxidoreductase n=1 Tax=Phenylobacterium sp. TaxID=1871053 RepID=UPI00260050F5|nr:SDR family NAD(P)-dependent oxidoreductase [Phenylobacterium sp.]
MKLETGQTALVTGASRGLGVEIARRLAAEGLDLILVARSRDALDQVAGDLRAAGAGQVRVLAADMSDLGSLPDLAQAVGAIDVLVNNAGMEAAAAYDERSPAEIADTIAVNLSAPMLLSHALLPGMLARGRGHIVNIASVAGLIAAPFNEPYSATKFGLVGFTRSLRMTARACGWPASASVVCPGFIDGAGMFETLKQDFGVVSDGMGTAPLHDVGQAVVDAIEQDLPDVIIADGDPRQMAAMAVVQPLAFETASLGAPSTAMFRAVAEARRGASNHSR